MENKKTKLTTKGKFIIGVFVVAIFGGLVYYFAPGLGLGESKTLETMTVDKTVIDNKSNAEMLPFPTDQMSDIVTEKPAITFAGYGWNGQTPFLAAIGGPVTTKGSLMEKAGLNMKFVRQDWLSELGKMQLNALNQFHSGKSYPAGDSQAVAVIIMGDGVPFYLSTTQAKINKIYGPGKYHLKVVGAMGMSNGEDKLIGPKKWKDNAKTMLGSVISVVPGDGDWVVLLNYCFANGLKVNPDFGYYDADAVNIYPSAEDDYMESAKELIKSQNNGWTVDLKIKKNGKMTNKIVKKKIDGCATWTPGDSKVFESVTGFTNIASTADYPNQMATTIVMISEWAEGHSKEVSAILKATLTAANQIKTHDAWHREASKCTARAFGLKDGNYWYNMAKGKTATKNGLEYSVGGTRYLSYADVLQYYGRGGDGINRYKAVYNQVGNYLLEMNPFNFKSVVGGKVVPYEEAIDLSFLMNINDIDAGTSVKEDYSEKKTNVMASGEWHIQFNVGSTSINPASFPELEKALGLLVQAEQTKITLVGHTDNTGNAAKNVLLSKGRANSVANWFKSKGLNAKRLQLVDGKGSSEPVATNVTNVGRAKNRRVQITLLN